MNQAAAVMILMKTLTSEHQTPMILTMVMTKPAAMIQMTASLCLTAMIRKVNNNNTKNHTVLMANLMVKFDIAKKSHSYSVAGNRGLFTDSIELVFELRKFQ